jgi:hypothetical protein
MTRRCAARYGNGAGSQRHRQTRDQRTQMQ